MKGAAVFLTVFLILIAVTLWYDNSIPPGKEIYKLLDVPESSTLVRGIPATTLVYAVFNGIVYGVIVWLVYSVIEIARRRKVALVKVEAKEPTVEPKKFCIECGAEISSKIKYCVKCGAAQ